MYTYKGLDKLTEVTENGKVTGSYTYYAGGQLASAIDWQGANIYQIPDKEGAGGAGHSAWIAQGSAGKFHTFDYNPKGSEGTRIQSFDSFEDALSFLNQDSNRYESYLEYRTINYAK